MAHGDSYSLLGLDPSASDADVRQAYKKASELGEALKSFCLRGVLEPGVSQAALRWHPDKNPQAAFGG